MPYNAIGMEGNFTGKHINTKGMTEKEVWTKIRHQVRKKHGIEHHEIQQWQLNDALAAEIVKLSSIPDVMISSKAETIRVVTARAEHFKSIGNHTHAELECRNAIDIIEKLVPPENFKDEA